MYEAFECWQQAHLMLRFVWLVMGGERWVQVDIASYHCFNYINVTDKTHVKGQTQRRGVVE